MTGGQLRATSESTDLASPAELGAETNAPIPRRAVLRAIIARPLIGRLPRDRETHLGSRLRKREQPSWTTRTFPTRDPNRASQLKACASRPRPAAASPALRAPAPDELRSGRLATTSMSRHASSTHRASADEELSIEPKNRRSQGRCRPRRIHRARALRHRPRPDRHIPVERLSVHPCP